MMAFDFQSVAQIVAARGLNTVIEGFALAGLSWAALRYFGAQSSMTRFVVWFSTLLVIAGLPLLSGITSPHVAAGSHLPEITLSGRWATGLFVAWALIASVLLARLILSLRHLYILRKKCHELDPGSYPALSEVAKDFSQLHRSRRIQLLSSNQLRVPTALGFFRPAVILPEWTLRDLSHEELKVIVLHELAHLRRWDDWTNLAQKFVKALFFFHPAVWWIDSRLALEREIACDDMVLEQTANARIYAASLVSVAEKVVAEKMRLGRALALAQGALGRVREVSHRVAKIMAADRPRTKYGMRPAFAMVATLAVLTVGAMPYAPELISFQSRPTPSFSAAADTVPAFGAKAIPASWTIAPSGPNLREAARTSQARVDHVSHRVGIIKARTVFPQRVIAATADAHRIPGVVPAKATAGNRPAETLLVMHSTQLDENGAPVWTLSVWRVRTANGYQQTIQETIAMSAL